MKALILREPGSLSIEQVKVPEPAPGEVLVRVLSATTCGTDLKAYLRGHPQIPMPGPFGHEYSGEVVSVGADAPFKPGDQVMGVHSAPCQNCYFCQAGDENLCESIMKTKVLGSYAEYLMIPARIARLNLFEKPAEISHSRACLLEPLACVAQGIRCIRTRVTDRVLVIGPGAIGLMFVAALRAVGLVDITIAGRNNKRLEVAEQLGARALAPQDVDASLGRGYDIVIECTGKVEVWEQSINYVRRGGQLVLFGGCPTGSVASFDTAKVHYDQITIHSPFHFGTQAVRQAREWLLNLDIPFDLLISGDRRLQDAVEVFESLKNGIGIKYAFRP